MDAKARAYIEEKEGVIAKLGERIAQLQTERAQLLRDNETQDARLTDLANKLSAFADLKAEGSKAHLADIGELSEYVKENARLVAALQAIADGKGKYAKIAKAALGQ